MSKYRSQKWYAANAHKHNSERNSKIDRCLGTICGWCPHGAINVSCIAHSSFAGKSMRKSTRSTRPRHFGDKLLRIGDRSQNPFAGVNEFYGDVTLTDPRAPGRGWDNPRREARIGL